MWCLIDLINGGEQICDNFDHNICHFGRLHFLSQLAPPLWYLLQNSYIEKSAVFLENLKNAQTLQKAANEEFPSKFLLYTEACAGAEPFNPPVVLGSWARGERYEELFDQLKVARCKHR